MKKTVNKNYSFLDRFIANLPAGLFAYTGLTIRKERATVKVLAEGGRSARDFRMAQLAHENDRKRAGRLTGI